MVRAAKAARGSVYSVGAEHKVGSEKDPSAEGGTGCARGAGTRRAAVGVDDHNTAGGAGTVSAQSVVQAINVGKDLPQINGPAQSFAYANDVAQSSSHDNASAQKKPPKRARTNAGRAIWAAGGLLSFALGMIGVVLPILPTTPFILLAAFCFARSSERLNTWFKGTAVYHKVLEGFVTKRTMTIKAKLSVIVPVTVLMGIGFALMGRVPVARIVLAIVWLAHIAYFGFIVKTDKETVSSEEQPQIRVAKRSEKEGQSDDQDTLDRTAC